jgi:hypothetical protein
MINFFLGGSKQQHYFSVSILSLRYIYLFSVHVIRVYEYEYFKKQNSQYFKN